MAGDEAGGGDGGRDDGRGQRVWHPVSMVPALTVVVDEQLAHSRTMLAKLEKARPTRPDAAVLDDATVSETRRVYGRMATDYRELFATQAQAWQAEAGLDVATRARVENFAARVDEHLVVTSRRAAAGTPPPAAAGTAQPRDASGGPGPRTPPGRRPPPDSHRGRRDERLRG